jgi:hypothetical protein
MTPPPFLPAEQEEAWSRLEYVVRQGWRCGLVVGPAETGKTTLLEAVAKSCNTLQVCRLDVAGWTRDDFAEQAAAALGDSVNGPWATLEDWFLGAAVTEQRSLWLIDHLDQSAEDLVLSWRRLMKLAEATRSPATFLGAVRDFAEVADLCDQIDLTCELPAWSATTTAAYLDRLQATHRASPFPAAVQQAYQDCTEGIPGRLRRLHELTRLTASAQPDRPIDVELVLQVWEELVSPMARIGPEMPR